MREGYAKAFTEFDRVRNRTAAAADTSEKRRGYWSEGPDDPLGAQYKTQIACLLVKEEDGVNLKRFAALIEEQQRAQGPSVAPVRRAGMASTVEGNRKEHLYDGDTYYRWIRHEVTCAPEGRDLELCVDLVLCTADHILERHRKPGARPLAELFDGFKGSVREAFALALSTLVSSGSARDWRTIPSRVHGVMPREERRAVASSEFDEKLDKVSEALGGTRSVQVSGPNYSGRNTLLRMVVSRYAEQGFQLDGGSFLTVCALSLYELSATEAIARLADFYRSAVGVRQRGETISELVAEIAHYSRQFPALIVISGLDAIDSDEVVRAIHQDVFGEVVSRVIDGHPDTRLLVSTSAGERVSARRRTHDEHRKTVPFDLVVDLAAHDMPPTNYEYYAIRDCAEALLERRGGQARTTFGHLWVGDDELTSVEIPLETSDDLGRLLAHSLLDDQERLCLGLVALSHDGLLRTTISSIAAALWGNASGDPPFDPVAVLDALPDEVIRKPVPEGALGPSCYKLERALRDRLLVEWRESSPAEFRLACWGIARAAADEARRLRVRSGLEVGAGRDVQVLLFLLASVDPTVPPDGSGRIAEREVLPSLTVGRVPAPHSARIIRFAFETLFRNDLARAVEHGVPVLSDARLRLAAVHPFIDGSIPWQSVGSVDDPRLWQPSEALSPWRHLDTTSRLRLLAFATSAAARLNHQRMIVTFARLAERLSEGRRLTAGEFVPLSRIQRYELDLQIMLGREADRSHPAPGVDGVPGLAGVERRVAHLIQSLPPHLADDPDCRAEMRTLRARRAEILHLRGRHVASLREFVATSHLDERLVVDAGAEAGTLVGRSRRMFTRLLVEMGRARLFDPESSAPVSYELDGLTLPIMHRAPERPWLLDKAERVVEESLRALPHGSVNDWIGVKIDRARLAAVQLHYGEALDQLDRARGLIRSPRASRDMLLEYLSVQGRTLADAAAFSMAAGAVSPLEPGPHADEIANLADYLRVDPGMRDPLPWILADTVSSRLSQRARTSLDTLRDLVVATDTAETRYEIFVSYLEVWISVVQSRERLPLETRSERSREVRAQLVSAARRFERVLAKMMHTGYLLSHREAWLLVEVLSSADVEVTVPQGMPTRPAKAREDK